MGFSWATFFAQTVSEMKLSSALPPLQSILLTDSSPTKLLPVSPQQALHYVYIDNLGLNTVSQQAVQSAMGRAQASFDADNLILHEIQIEAGGQEALGMMVDCSQLATYNTWKRFGRIRKAISAILSRTCIAGWVVEVLVGHCTYFSMVNRDLLLIFHTIYAFVQKHYVSPAPLWKSVREEIMTFQSLMIFGISRWWWPWSPMVYCYDASLKGFGVSSIGCDVEMVGKSEESKNGLGGN